MLNMKRILKTLSEKRPIFHSEADFLVVQGDRCSVPIKRVIL
ncbi:hypothetical protein [Bacillus massilinigeriensis]|nr:hypothetical protein [Bacillus massilionigeriensis]